MIKTSIRCCFPSGKQATMRIYNPAKITSPKKNIPRGPLLVLPDYPTPFSERNWTLLMFLTLYNILYDIHSYGIFIKHFLSFVKVWSDPFSAVWAAMGPGISPLAFKSRDLSVCTFWGGRFFLHEIGKFFNFYFFSVCLHREILGCLVKFLFFPYRESPYRETLD